MGMNKDYSMKKLLPILIVCLLFVATGCEKNKYGEIKVVSTEEMQTLLKLDDVQLVDIRTKKEFSEGYTVNSQNIDFKSPTFEADINKLDKTKPVVLYCKQGTKSTKCAEKMKDAGFVMIYDLEGGISKWKHKGFKIKTIE
jgi:rhodanese-related sulfurtransferase